jgi:hypothetical protein
MRRLIPAIAALVTLAVLAAPARAGLIADLYSTGVDNNGVTLGNGVTDTHYRLTVAPVGAGSGTTTYVVNPGGFPIPPWFPNDAVGTAGGSMWISGPRTPAVGEPNGRYIYHTTFTIGAGIDPNSVRISGFLTADDKVEVALNGNGNIVVPFTPDQGYGSIYSFSINSGFRAGSNELNFLVQNTHESVEGLRVVMTSSAVPEPASLAMMGLGVAGSLAGYRLRRRKVTVA